jgi:DNA (cytosine-5)-methyltransferase 1
MNPSGQFILNLAAKLVIVLFAGAGGSCTGIEQAIGRPVDIAANHNPDALSCHQRNHPQTRHYREDVRALHPRELCGNQSVGYLHLSPDCTHFSQAKGGQPRDTAIRSLPWVAIRWAGTVMETVYQNGAVQPLLFGGEVA